MPEFVYAMEHAIHIVESAEFQFSTFHQRMRRKEYFEFSSSVVMLISMVDLEAFYRVFLNEELNRRKRKNSRYSLRSFAKNLDVDNGQLSKIMKGRAFLSVDLASDIAQKLGLSGDIRDEFIISAADEQRCLSLSKIDSSLTDCAPDLPEENSTGALLPKKDRL